MTKQIIKKVIILSSMVLVLVGTIIGNYVCYLHESEITSYLVPQQVSYDTTHMQEALNASDVVVQQIAAEGITMLKNNGTLPLKAGKDDLNMFGIGGTDSAVNGFYLFGGGSGSVTLDFENAVYPKQGFEDAGFKVNQSLYEFFATRTSNPTVSWWGLTQNILNQAKIYSDTAVITISRFTGENCEDTANASDTSSYSKDSPYPTSYVDSDTDGRNMVQLSLREEAMIDYCSKNFKNVVVIINSGNIMELGYLDRAEVDAILYVPYPGQSGTKQIGKILAGDTNPSGHLTDTFMYDTKNDPTWANAFMKDQNGKQIHYVEDIYVGYKWYETAYHTGYFTASGTSYSNVVWRPFGYGLSYTNFEWTVKDVTYKKGQQVLPLESGATLTDPDITLRFTVEVKNIGSVPGKEVVQLYSTPPYTNGGIEKAYVNLAAFEKTDVLYPSDQADDTHPNSQLLILEVDPYYLASYDCYNKNGNAFTGWELEGGTYRLKLQNNAHEINACAGAEFIFNVSQSGFKWEVDPESGGSVHNRFTGETAEANVPIDGNSNGGKITYLSRADFIGTFPSATTANRTSGADITINGTYVTDAAYYANVVRPELNNTENQYYLFTREDGTKAALADLNYSASGSKIVPNEELILKLGKDYNDPAWEKMLSQLTFIEIADIVTRCSQGTMAAESIGKPKDMVFDGPAGLCNNYLSPDALKDVSAFPASALVGMTWNKDLARQEGAAMGVEVSLTGTIGMYAPAVDLHRHAYNGRNFEQYGEDPILSGWMGAKVVYGMLTHGIQGSVKHFVCSQPGKNPRDYNTWLTEQNLRENYLRAFEICVKEGKTNYIMTSFNNIGGVRCAYSYQLLNGVLREEWGFKGSVITDYNVNSPTRTTASLIRSGNDLRFQGSIANRAEISQDNDVDVYLARLSVKNSLYSYCNTYFHTKTYDPTYTATQITIVQPFVWWVLLLIILDVIICTGIGFVVFICFFRKKSKNKMSQ